MWIVKMNGDFVALFALECDASAMRRTRLQLFPDAKIEVLYFHADVPEYKTVLAALTAE